MKMVHTTGLSEGLLDFSVQLLDGLNLVLQSLQQMAVGALVTGNDRLGAGKQSLSSLLQNLQQVATLAGGGNGRLG